MLQNSYVVLCNNSDIRLAGGSDQYEGRVEICFNETWGTICDGSWSVNDANVACRQLGYAATGKYTLVHTIFFIRERKVLGTDRYCFSALLRVYTLYL